MIATLADLVVWGSALALLNIVLAAAVTVHAAMHKRDGRAVVAWIGLAWLTPLIGSLAYAILGVNRIDRKAVALASEDTLRLQRQLWVPASERVQAEALLEGVPGLRGVISAGRWLTGIPVVPGNSVTPLIDGDEAYPAMIAAIDGARESVALLSYIFDADYAGQQFMDALARASERGVEVRVLVDDIGSKYSSPNMVKRLKKAGVKAAAFLPTHLPRIPTYANLRNHRKILVVDGETGFTGGTNIREGHLLQRNVKEPVQCVHFQLGGPVVAQLQRVFAGDWAFATGELISGETWFPEIARAGEVWARGIEHGPGLNFEKLLNMFSAALASARKRVRIVTPYLLPDISLIKALNVTAMRGVEVEILIPQKSNIRIVQWATMGELLQMLEFDVSVKLLPPPFDHTKLMVVDDAWSLIGSANWDPRSLRLNFEFNVECYDENLAAQINQIIDRKASNAVPITLEQLAARSYPRKLRDGLARLFKPYL